MADWKLCPAGRPYLTRLGFRTTQRTGTPPTYRISLQGAGLPEVPSG